MASAIGGARRCTARAAFRRYHYLGYKTLVGAQLCYAVHASDGTPLAMLGFSTEDIWLRPLRKDWKRTLNR